MMYSVLDESIKSQLNWAKDYLRSHYVPNAELDAELIMSHVFGASNVELHIKEHVFGGNLLSEFKRLIVQRGKRCPLQYLTGSVNFVGLELKIEKGVFIPRPETELIVEEVLNLVGGPRDGCKIPRILDMCTGSGNIAIGVSNALKDAEIVASDISRESISLACENGDRHKLENIEFLKSDMFAKIENGNFDVIVANPPYVSREDLKEAAPEISHEPVLALDGGKDGLDFYRRFFKEAHKFLKKDGHIVLEIGYDQADSIRILADSGNYFCQRIIKDYNDIDRIAVIRRENG